MFDEAIGKLQARYDEASQDQKRIVEDASTIDFESHSVFQETKSLWQASGLITLDVASWLYQVLGPNVNHFNRQSVGTRLFVLTFFASKGI